MQRFDLLAAAHVGFSQAADLDQIAHSAPFSPSFTASPSLDELPVGEPLLARIVPLGLDELGADLGKLGAGGGQLGLSQCELGFGLGIIEPGQHVALLDLHAFLDQDLGDFPGDLR